MSNEEKDQVYEEYLEYCYKVQRDPSKEDHDELMAIAKKLCHGMVY
jgi:preprotein translocase subunit Sss1